MSDDRTKWNGLRRSGFKRKPCQLKRSRIRSRSTKKAREINETKDARRQYLEADPTCAVCGGPAIEINEISRGPSRQQGVRDADAWCRTCRTCHDNELGDYSRWPIPKQIALKWLTVLRTINAHREGRPQASLLEVVDELKRLAAEER